jgi:hypothetical protein
VEPCGVDCRSHVGFGLCSTQSSVAVCDFSLDHARAEFALRGVVGDVDFAEMVAKGRKQVSRAPWCEAAPPASLSSDLEHEVFLEQREAK